MRRTLPSLIAIFVVAAGCLKPQGKAPPPIEEAEPLPAPAAADAEARAIVDKAIKAHGGEAAVAKMRSMRIKAEGTAFGMPFVIEDIWQMPGSYKTISTFRHDGKDVSQTQAIDGDKGWSLVNGMVQEFARDGQKEFREQKYGEDFDRLGFLKDPDITLSLAGEAQVNGAPAAGVKIQSKGHRDVTLYFDKKSELLVKRADAVLDLPTRKEVVREVVFSNHDLKDGVMHYRRIVGYYDGKEFADAKITEIDFLPKIDDKVFAKP